MWISLALWGSENILSGNLQNALKISYSDWKKLGFSKGALHYMKQNAKSDKSFSLNSHVLERIKAWDNLVSGGAILKFKGC